jgi:hypothetical protein
MAKLTDNSHQSRGFFRHEPFSKGRRWADGSGRKKDLSGLGLANRALNRLRWRAKRSQR